jgi:hypothetical protein
MGGVWLRQLLLASRRKRAVRFQRRKKIGFDTREGLLLVFGIAGFVALIFALVYFVWYLPIQRAVQ